MKQVCANKPINDRFKFVHVDEFNKLLKMLKTTRLRSDTINFKETCLFYVEETESQVFAVFYNFGIRCRYICRKDDKIINVINPKIAWQKLVKLSNIKDYYLIDQYGYQKNPDTNKVKWGDMLPVSGYQWFSDKYRYKKLEHCYQYDINSAYAWAMIQDMPDTTKPARGGFLESDDEIGFRTDGSMVLKSDGDYILCDYIFKKMKSPLIDFVNKYYELKKTTKDKRYKNILVENSGMMQRYNIFFRFAIIEYATRHIKQYIDKNTVYVNTDSIISLKRRLDLPISDKIGEFKEEIIDDTFTYSKFGNYSWQKAKICKHQGKTTKLYKFNSTKLIMETI